MCVLFLKYLFIIQSYHGFSRHIFFSVFIYPLLLLWLCKRDTREIKSGNRWVFLARRRQDFWVSLVHRLLKSLRFLIYKRRCFDFISGRKTVNRLVYLVHGLLEKWWLIPALCAPYLNRFWTKSLTIINWWLLLFDALYQRIYLVLRLEGTIDQ